MVEDKRLSIAILKTIKYKLMLQIRPYDDLLLAGSKISERCIIHLILRLEIPVANTYFLIFSIEDTRMTY